jgi:hypothetical protein
MLPVKATCFSLAVTFLDNDKKKKYPKVVLYMLQLYMRLYNKS